MIRMFSCSPPEYANLRITESQNIRSVSLFRSKIRMFSYSLVHLFKPAKTT